MNQLWREKDAKQRDHAHENGGQGCDFVSESPGRFIAFGGDFFREGGDERGRESAFGKQIAQQIWQPKSHQERVQIFAGAEKSGENLLPNQSKHSRAHYRNTDDAGRARAYSLRLSHRRTKNNVSE